MNAQANVVQSPITAQQGMEEIRRQITNGQTVPVTVTGGSMTPLLRDRRDGIILAKIEQWPPKIGEIIFCQRVDSSPVMHRVIGHIGRGVVLNGDGQTWIEGPIYEEQALARVQTIRRASRFIDADAPLLRCYSVLWLWLKPARKTIFRLYRIIFRRNILQ
ncbi:hypothetical protein FACS18948_2520 [Clostridia bacterium]|nr:hypothetical protein FACS18948_2520 [Clostridia bacterium]